ncbi:glycosyltransferase family 2 protein [Tunicatimonas pelagia]|uniref:glycosyltransferase family 2 protein n=1 Tax=Tunicatimonas pelagia TaxID=931531 RepID=UPI002665607D|nr:glycosyltransferase family A protein [Tunicatimonas pelagia]WKN40718.1 glycosyltransferase family A protein [Tunicatimonas pelagia]
MKPRDNTLAPVVLFVYNRPDHTLRTLEALSLNELAKDSVLYIYADGPKTNSDEKILARIAETREVLYQKKWCKEVHIREAKENKGLADSIVGGVTEVINKYGKVIVLEDDIVTSPGFLKYMNDGLNIYESYEEVMHISGYFPPVSSFHELPETFFYNQTSCWGWGTWDKSWKFFNNNAKALLHQVLDNNLEYQFNIDNAYQFTYQLEANIKGELKTWAVKWHASVFLQDGLCLHPNQSLVRNIGFDGTGVHCGDSPAYRQQSVANYIQVHKQPLVESALARKKVKKYLAPKISLRKNFKKKIKRLLWN